MSPMPVQSLLLVVVFAICFSSVVSSDPGCNFLTFGQTIEFGDLMQCITVAASGDGNAYCCYGITRKPYCCSKQESGLNFVLWFLAGLSILLFGLCKICGCCCFKKDRNERIVVVQREPYGM